VKETEREGIDGRGRGKLRNKWGDDVGWEIGEG
jgi:hypothetical protein